MLKRILILIFGIGIPLVMIVAVFVGYSWVFESNVNVKEPYEVYVFPEENPRDVLNKLLAANVVKDKASFVLLAQQKRWHNAKPGRYLIEPGMSNNDLINMFRGGMQAPMRLTINMATSVADVCGQAGKQLMADSNALFVAFTDEAFLADNRLNFATVRSIIIPNTYEVYWSSTAVEFRDRMVKEYYKFWNSKRTELAKGINLSPTEVSTLASIVEKETAKAEEMPIVAALYLNRLKKGMYLQSDPTVIYARQLRDPGVEITRVLYADLEIDSPYNTYRNPGLPPAPITIPSITAIDAVLHADNNDYLFMCADPERPGYHSFAKNSAQHQLNVRKWHKWLNDNNIMR